MFVCFVVLCFVVCVLLFCVLLFIVDVHMWFLHARRATHRKHDVFRWCGNRCFIVLHMYLWILTLNFQETRACISKCTWLFNVFCCWNWTCICFFFIFNVSEIRNYVFYILDICFVTHLLSHLLTHLLSMLVSLISHIIIELYVF